MRRQATDYVVTYYPTLLIVTATDYVVTYYPTLLIGYHHVLGAAIRYLFDKTGYIQVEWRRQAAHDVLRISYHLSC